MSDEELRAYNQYQDSLRDEASYVETNYHCAKMEGHAEGHAEGKEEGKEETTITIALKLMQQGVGIEIIKAVTGLSIAAIEDLEKSVR